MATTVPGSLAGPYPRGAFTFDEDDAIDPASGDTADTVVTGATALDAEDGVIDGQPMVVRVEQGSGGSHAWTLSSAFEVPAAVDVTPSTTEGDVDTIGMKWHEGKGKWVVLCFTPGEV